MRATNDFLEMNRRLSIWFRLNVWKFKSLPKFIL